jgi:hypothetical protein
VTASVSFPDLPSAPFPLAILRALLDRLIPSEDGFPGAVDAGVENYLARQFAGSCAHEATRLARGLLQLDAESFARHGVPFVSLAPSRQDALLGDLEKGRAVSSWPVEVGPAAFFARMVDLAHEGFYSDPGNGGNREAISWRMIGYDPRLPSSATDHASKAAPNAASRSDSGAAANHFPG